MTHHSPRHSSTEAATDPRAGLRSPHSLGSPLQGGGPGQGTAAGLCSASPQQCRPPGAAAGLTGWGGGNKSYCQGPGGHLHLPRPPEALSPGHPSLEWRQSCEAWPACDTRHNSVHDPTPALPLSKDWSLTACPVPRLQAGGTPRALPHGGASLAAGVGLSRFFPFPSSCSVSCFLSDCQTHTMVFKSGKI